MVNDKSIGQLRFELFLAVFSLAAKMGCYALSLYFYFHNGDLLRAIFWLVMGAV